MTPEILTQRLMELERKIFSLARDVTNLRNDLEATMVVEKNVPNSGRR